MKMKLLLLAARVFTTLALAALPAISFAGDFEARCEGAATCEGTITSAGAQAQYELENDAGYRLRCTELGVLPRSRPQ
jgi:hypothetical protein